MPMGIVKDGIWYFGLLFRFQWESRCYCGDSDLVLRVTSASSVDFQQRWLRLWKDLW